MTIDEAVGLMRGMVGEPADVQCQAMMALADVWEEADGTVTCDRCVGGLSTFEEAVYGGTVTQTCGRCLGRSWVPNGNGLRAEALRLLAELGLVGNRAGYIAPWQGRDDLVRPNKVCESWYDAGIAPYAGNNDSERYCDPILNRLWLMDAYAAADRETRERWAAETRALGPTANARCPDCDGLGVVDGAGWAFDCGRCGRTGKVVSEVTA